MGLSLPLHGISFLFGGAGGIRLETEAEVDSNSARWRFCFLDQSQHRVAMVVDRKILDQRIPDQRIPNHKIPDLNNPEQETANPAIDRVAEDQNPPFPPPLQIFEARPPCAAPMRLPSGSETWFPRLAVAARQVNPAKRDSVEFQQPSGSGIRQLSRTPRRRFRIHAYSHLAWDLTHSSTRLNLNSTI